MLDLSLAVSVLHMCENNEAGSCTVMSGKQLASIWPAQFWWRV